jgi:hypothetical protein
MRGSLWSTGALCTLSLSGCSSKPLNTDICPRIDFFELGHQDALSGQAAESNRFPAATAPVDEVASKDSSCPISPTEHEAYRSGYNLGLKDFCTTSHAVEMGRAGLENKGQCNDINAAFNEGFNRGRKIFELIKENEEINLKVQEFSLKLTQDIQNKMEIEKTVASLKSQREINLKTIQSLE